MIRWHVAPLVGVLLFAASAFGASEGPHDVVVYGGSPSGLAAAVQAARMGSRVVVVEPYRHLGGMMGKSDGNAQWHC